MNYHSLASICDLKGKSDSILNRRIDHYSSMSKLQLEKKAQHHPQLPHLKVSKIISM